MRTLGLVVGRNETWSFVQDLYDIWRNIYAVTVFEERPLRPPFFQERLKRRQLQSDLSALLNSNDAVFFEWASELLALASRMPRRARIVTRLHRYEMYQWADRVDWNGVDAIILVSRAKEREFLERFPEQRGKTYVVHEAIDMNGYTYQHRPFDGTLGVLCHLTPRKRVYELILAFFEMRRLDVIEWLRIGGGPQPLHADYAFALADLVSRLGLAERVIFDGPVSDAAAWYRSVDVFVSNSYSEGLQVAPIEAMASGCFTLSHNWAGAGELLPPDCLFITEPELVARVAAYAQLPAEDKAAATSRLRILAEERFDIRFTEPIIRAILEGEPRVA